MSELTADQIVWTPAPLPRPSSDPLLGLVLEMLPAIEDEAIAVLIEELAILLTDRDEEIAARRDVQSVTLEALHEKIKEVDQLRARHIELRDELRDSRREAAAR